MKRTLLSITALFFTSFLIAGPGHNITIKVSGYKNQICYLGYYFGDKQYIRDSARCDANGKFVFKGPAKLDGGIYLLATHDKHLLFDFVVTEQEFTLETDTSDVIGHMKVKNSYENDVFFSYSKFTQKIGESAEVIKANMKKAVDRKDTATFRELRSAMIKEEDKVIEFRKQVIKDHPKTLMAKVFAMMEEVDVPPAPKLPNGATDSTFQYYYYRAQLFFNIVDGSEAGLLTIK